MIFKKRTKEEEDAAVAAGDLTGGYDYWPWFFIKRKFFVLAVPLLLLFSIGTIWDSYNNGDMVYRVAGIVGIIMTFLLKLRIRIEYKRMKKGNLNS